jgi:competence protein ComEC
MLAKKYKILFFVLAITAVLGAAIFLYFYQPSKNLEVDFLDVGQGDAILIKSPYGQNILIDGGPDSSVIKRLGENLPWWDRTIDLMVLTHPHDDHVTGEIDVLNRFKTKQIIYTGVAHTAPNYLNWLETIREAKTPIGIIINNRRVDLGPNCYLEIVYPDEDLSEKSFADLNESSIVAKLVYGRTSFLLAGDADSVVEKKVFDSKIDLKSDVLKVGHHGSDTSTSDDWLAAVKPDIAVISVGAGNSFGHPSLRTVKKLERAGAKILRTDLDGTVRLVSDGLSINSKP